ncbi:cyclase [Nocardioides baekrokdamisoli]|uniref:Cyclase n=1 Tax=Nocardioides baekrokdamisoli TaxID=1804624 RepID=A0A3G9IJ27_9ACTN|nr:SRPBCC family protein [Nocardioides baekrokdamisoli]BBH18296.1 cyclase [Nocardioides baekrokdamisoli]
MTELTTSSIVIAATPERVLHAIADFAAYPSWAKGVKSADVLSSDAQGRPAQVRFVLDVPPISDTYTLSYVWDGNRSVTWTLVESVLLRSLDGTYELKALADGTTEVSYRLQLDLMVPVIGMLKRKGEKVLIETALRGLKTYVEKN